MKYKNAEGLRKIKYVLLGYWLIEILRIIFIFIDFWIFDLYLPRSLEANKPLMPNVYYWIGEKLLPLLKRATEIYGIILVGIAFVYLIKYKSRGEIIKSLIKINSTIIVVAVFMSYFTKLINVNSPTVYTYCLINLRNIFVAIPIYIVYEIVCAKIVCDK